MAWARSLTHWPRASATGLSPDVQALWALVSPPNSLAGTELPTIATLPAADCLDRICSDIHSAQDSGVAGSRSHDHYKALIRRLHPHFMAIHRAMLSRAGNSVAVHPGLQWLVAPALFLRRVTADDLRPLVTLLVVLPVLERSLTRLWPHCCPELLLPPLLRDLVTHPALQAALGPGNSLVLEVLFGSPLSVNLRNIVWHGFAQDVDVHPVFVSVVHFLALSIGETLQDQGWCPPQPHFVTLPSTSGFPALKRERLNDVPDHSCPHLDSIRTNVLKQCHHHVDTTAMLLVRLEFDMRRLFCLLNRCPARTLTAENSVLYLTFKEILSPTVEPGNVANILPDYLGSGLFGLLLDLLILPRGPRLRDRLSHAEVDMERDSEFLPWSQVVLFANVKILEFTEHFLADSRPRLLTHRVIYHTAYWTLSELIQVVGRLHLFSGQVNRVDWFKSVLELDILPLSLPCQVGFSGFLQGSPNDLKERLHNAALELSPSILNRPKNELDPVTLSLKWLQALDELIQSSQCFFSERQRQIAEQLLSQRKMASTRKFVLLLPQTFDIAWSSLVAIMAILKVYQRADWTCQSRPTLALLNTLVRLAEKSASLLRKRKLDDLGLVLIEWNQRLEEIFLDHSWGEVIATITAHNK